MSTLTRYQEQLERVRRYYRLFREIDEGKKHDRPTDYDQDSVYAFFTNCHHLKDWIINDQSAGVAEATVYDFINPNNDLRLCADICNGIKHLRRTTARSGLDPRFGKRKFKVELGGLGTTIRVKYEIDTSGGVIDAFGLATRCLQAWEEFITSNLKPKSSHQ